MFFLALSCGKREPVRIGFVGGLSGRVADLGIGGRDGALLAVEMRNAAGGIAGRPVELLVKDDRQDPAEARRAVKELLAEKVQVIVGHMTSAMSVETVPLVNEGKVPMVSPTTTTTLLSGLDDQFLRVIGATDRNARELARHVADDLNIRRVAAVYDTNNAAYTESWLKEFEGEFLSRGGRVVRKYPFRSAPNTDFRIIAERLSTVKVPLLFVANATDTAMFCQQIHRNTEKHPLFFAAEWAGTEELIRLGGKSVEGVRYSQFFDRTSRHPRYVAFRDAYHRRFGGEPGFPAVAGFDAANVALEALAKRNPGESPKDAILRIGTFHGVQGDFRIDRFGDADRNVFIAEVRGGAFHLVR